MIEIVDFLFLPAETFLKHVGFFCATVCVLAILFFFFGRLFTAHLYLVFCAFWLLDIHKEVKSQGDTTTEGRHPPESDHSTSKVVVGVQRCVGAGKRNREEVTERVIWPWAPSPSLIVTRTLLP